ncbi:zf-HC2 domain-containing protein [Nakamurella sp. A5-74]|uniref:Zf-HC2 domain-containing protein n=1 Tax=Nakamurella sp. A5-74 TaxID=3158264 RepID=A0AAU8DJP5_9ACTN
MSSFFSEAFADHLSFDAVVAFADGELSLAAYQRAAAHIARCTSCAGEVAEQTQARELLRSAFAPKMPGSLFDQLRSIPVALPVSSVESVADVAQRTANRSWFGRH